MSFLFSFGIILFWALFATFLIPEMGIMMPVAAIPVVAMWVACGAIGWSHPHRRVPCIGWIVAIAFTLFSYSFLSSARIDEVSEAIPAGPYSTELLVFTVELIGGLLILAIASSLRLRRKLS